MFRTITLAVAFALLATTGHAQFDFDDIDLTGSQDPFAILTRAPATQAPPSAMLTTLLQQFATVLRDGEYTDDREYDWFSMDLETLNFAVDNATKQALKDWVVAVAAEQNDFTALATQFEAVAAQIGFSAEMMIQRWRDQAQEWNFVTSILRELSARLQPVSPDSIPGISWGVIEALATYGYPTTNESYQGMNDWVVALQAAGNNTYDVAEAFYVVAASVNESPSNLVHALRDLLTQMLDEGERVYFYLMEVKQVLNSFNFTYIRQFSVLIAQELYSIGLPQTSTSAETIYMWTAGLYNDNDGDIGAYITQFYEVAAQVNKTATELAEIVWRDLTAQMQGSAAVTAHLIDIQHLLNMVEFRYLRGISEFIAYQLVPLGYPFQNDTLDVIYTWTTGLYMASDVTPYVQIAYDVAALVNVSAADLTLQLQQDLSNHLSGAMSVVTDLTEVKRLLKTAEFQYVEGLSMFITANLVPYGLPYNNESIAMVYNWTSGLYMSDDIGPYVEQFYEVAYMLNTSAPELAAGLRQLMTDHFTEVYMVARDLLNVKILLNTHIEFRYLGDLSLLITGNLVPYGLPYNNESIAMVYHWTAGLYNEENNIGPYVEQFYELAYSLNVSADMLSAGLLQLLTNHFTQMDTVVGHLVEMSTILMTVSEDVLPGLAIDLSSNMAMSLNMNLTGYDVIEATVVLTELRNGNFEVPIKYMYDLSYKVGQPVDMLSEAILNKLRDSVALGMEVYYDIYEASQVLQKLDDAEVENVVLATLDLLSREGVVVSNELEQGLRAWKFALAQPGSDLQPLIQELYRVAATIGLDVRFLSGSLVDYLRREYYTASDSIGVVAYIVQQINVAYLKNISMEITESLMELGIPVPEPQLQMQLFEWIENLAFKPDDLPLYIQQFSQVAAMVNVSADELAYGLLTEVEGLAEAFPAGFDPTVQNIINNLPMLMELISTHFPTFYNNINSQIQQFGIEAWANITANLTNYFSNSPDQAFMFQNKLPEIASLLGITLPPDVLQGNTTAIVQYIQSQLPDMHILMSAVQQWMEAMMQEFPVHVVTELMELFFGFDIPADFSFEPTYIIQQLPLFLSNFGIQVPNNYYEMVMAWASFQPTPEWFANNADTVLSPFGIVLPADFQPTAEYVTANLDKIIAAIVDKGPEVNMMAYNITGQIMMQIHQNVNANYGGDYGVFIKEVISTFLGFLPGASDYFGFELPDDYRPELSYFLEMGIREFFDLIPTKDEYIAMIVSPIAATLAPNDTWYAELLADQISLLYDLNMVYLDYVPTWVKWIGRWLGYEIMIPDDFKFEPDWFISMIPQFEMWLDQNAQLMFILAVDTVESVYNHINMWYNQWMMDSQAWNNMVMNWFMDLPMMIGSWFGMHMGEVAVPEWMTWSPLPLELDWLLTDGCVHAIAHIMDLDIPDDYTVDDLEMKLERALRMLFILPPDYDFSFLADIKFQWNTFVMKPLDIHIPDDFRPSLAYLPDVMMHFGINPPDNFEPTMEYFIMRAKRFLMRLGFELPRDTVMEGMTMTEWSDTFFLMNAMNWDKVIMQAEMVFAELAAEWSMNFEKIKMTLVHDGELILAAMAEYSTDVANNFEMVWQKTESHVHNRVEALHRKMYMYVQHMMRLGKANFKAMVKAFRHKVLMELHYLAHKVEEFLSNNKHPVLQMIAQQFQKPTHPMMDMMSGFLDQYFQAHNKHPVEVLHDYLHDRHSMTSRPMFDVISDYLDKCTNRPSRPVMQKIMNYFSGKKQAIMKDIADYLFGMDDHTQRPFMQMMTDDFFGNNHGHYPTLQAIAENFFGKPEQQTSPMQMLEDYFNGHSSKPDMHGFLEQLLGGLRPKPMMQGMMEWMASMMPEGEDSKEDDDWFSWLMPESEEDEESDMMSWLFGDEDDKEDDMMSWLFGDEDDKEDDMMSWFFGDDDMEDDKDDSWFSWMMEDDDKEHNSWFSWMMGEDDKDDDKDNWWASMFGSNSKESEEDDKGDMWYSWFFTPPMEQDQDSDEHEDWFSWMKPQDGDQPDNFVSWLLSDNYEMYTGYDHIFKPMKAMKQIRGRQWG